MCIFNYFNFINRTNEKKDITTNKEDNSEIPTPKISNKKTDDVEISSKKTKNETETKINAEIPLREFKCSKCDKETSSIFKVKGTDDYLCLKCSIDKTMNELEDWEPPNGKIEKPDLKLCNRCHIYKKIERFMKKNSKEPKRTCQYCLLKRKREYFMKHMKGK